MQLHGGAESPLQQGGVQVLGDARAFAEPFFKLAIKLRCDPAHPPPICRPDQADDRSGAEQNKPSGLVESRRNVELNRRPLLIPHTIVVASNDAKCILPRGQVVVKRFATGSWLLPLLIVALQFVAEADLLRNDKAERCIINFEITSQRR